MKIHCILSSINGGKNRWEIYSLIKEFTTDSFPATSPRSQDQDHWSVRPGPAYWKVVSSHVPA